jgi:ketosteroid isomerase-like protein
MTKTLFNKVIPVFLLVCVIIPVSAQSAEEWKLKISRVNKEMQQAMINGNTAAGLAYYANDAVSLPNYGKMAAGLEAIRKSNEEMMSGGFKILSFETDIHSVKPCGNMITEVGMYKMSYTQTGMPNPVEDKGKYLTIWEQQNDGSLKIKVEIWNTDTYPMAGN